MVNVEYVACLMCGKTLAKRRFTKEGLRIRPSEFYALQVREQVGGRSGKQGFFLIPSESKNILQLLEGSEEEKEIAQCLVDRVLMIAKDFLKEGIISRSQLVTPRKKK